MNEPDRPTCGSFRPDRVRRIARDTGGTASFCVHVALVELVLHPQELVRLLLGELEHRDPRPDRQDLGDLLLVDLDRCPSRRPSTTARAGCAPCLELPLLVAQLRRQLEVLAVDRGFLLRRTSAIFLVDAPASGGAVMRRMRIREPASSIRSIALSGRNRSEM